MQQGWQNILTLKGGSGFLGTGRASGGKFSTSSAVGSRLLLWDFPDDHRK